MRAEVECQSQGLGGSLVCEFVKDGAGILKSEVDALFDALRGVAREKKDAARAHFDEQRQLSVRPVLHFVNIDLTELAVGPKRVSLHFRRLSEGAVDCESSPRFSNVSTSIGLPALSDCLPPVESMPSTAS